MIMHYTLKYFDTRNKIPAEFIAKNLKIAYYKYKHMFLKEGCI